MEPSVTVNHDLTLMPKQARFVFDDDHWEILYSGAFGAGKSRALCCRAVRLAQFAGARVGLVRKTLADLKASTLITLLEPDGDLPPVLHPESYTFHKAESWIEVHGGGTIVLFGCDDQAKIGSRPLTDICIDEGIELEKEEYDMLLGRRRGKYTRPDGKENTRSICTATNPGPPSHFLYKRFFEQVHPKRLLIETSTAENYHLPVDYTQSMNELSGPARDRYFLGRWVAFEGAIYWMFDPLIHEKHDPGPFDRYVAGVDWGFKNPSAIRVHGLSSASDGRGRKSHVVSEYYRNMTVSNEFVEICKATKDRYNPLVFVVDPSAADLKAQMRRAGLTVFEGDNDVQAGIRRVESDLTPGVDGPILTMEPTCKLGNSEYPAYRWNDATLKEQPVKEFDHALDADRYARMYIHRNSGSGRIIRLGLGGKERPVKEVAPEDRDITEERWFDGGLDGGDRRIRKMNRKALV